MKMCDRCQNRKANVIDRQPYTWEQFGEIVKSFEEFQIQMKFFDVTDDVR